MSRTAEVNLQEHESRVLSIDAPARVAFEVPTMELATFADGADIELGETEGPNEGETAGDGGDPPDSPVLTCSADLRVIWGEMNEWLEQS
jgi:hypothetical protein